MPNDKAPLKVYNTSFFQPRSLPSSKNIDHTFADKMDRLRELIYRAEQSVRQDEEAPKSIDLSRVRFRTGARAGSLQIMSQRIAA